MGIVGHGRVMGLEPGGIVSIREKKNCVGLASELRVGLSSGVLASEARGPSYAGLPLETRFYPIG